jgi:5'-deoxy-5'-methylthioadenosine phosphorylase
MLAIIGGSGLTQLANLDVSNREVMRTPYGAPSGALTLGEIGQQPVIFLARHGYGHTIPPHEVNYRANIWALWKRGATGIISVASVGSIRPDLKPGDLVIPHQIIDYTWGRKSTYHEGPDCKVTHIDFTEPYDRNLRQRLIDAADVLGVPCSASAVYAATQGPRLETAAEIDRLERDGADLVGMTGMPEAVLARELAIPYAAINVVANYGAGRADSREGISFDAIQSVLHGAMGRVRVLIEQLLKAQGNA